MLLNSGWTPIQGQNIKDWLGYKSSFHSPLPCWEIHTRLILGQKNRGTYLKGLPLTIKMEPLNYDNDSGVLKHIKYMKNHVNNNAF